MRRNILIADNNSTFRRTLRRTLEGDPRWRVCGEAEDGRDAIDKAQQLMPDLILLDLTMPVMDGFETARVLSRLMPEVPIILVTLFGGNIHFQGQARAAGVAMVVSKQDGVDTLIAGVQTALSLPHQASLSPDGALNQDAVDSQKQPVLPQ